jgi:Uma2 family endonuclease
MEDTRHKAWTLETFLEWEERQEFRYEFDGVEPIEREGATEAHASIQVGILGVVGSRLKGPPCRITGSSLKLRIGDRIRYPDAMILCSPMVPTRTIVTDPVTVFEIISPETVEIDMVQKSAEYRSLPSLQRYVIPQQTRIAGLVLARKGDDWLMQDLIGDAATLCLPGIEVQMAEIYEDVGL